MHARVTTLAAAAFLALATAVGISASNFLTIGLLVQVSGTSPFAAGCDPGQTGVNYLNSEVEPWIDVNPALAGNLVGTWQQDRWSDGGSRGLMAAASFDGGGSWISVIIPKITQCSGGNAGNGGNYQRATDPWVSFAPNGHVYQLALSFNDFVPPFTEFDFDHALLASKSTDGGLTWSDPKVVIRDTDANVFNDKQSITADPTNASRVYAVWDRLVFPTSERANVIAGFVSSSFRGPVWFARTTNGGTTWEAARQIYDPGQNDQTIGNQIVVLPNGTLVDVFNEIHNDNSKKQRGYSVRVIRSTNQGATWSSPIFIDLLGTIFVTDPESGDDVRTGDIIPDIAVAPNGDLYAVWQDARPSGGRADAIVLSRSEDGGLTWSARVKVNKTPANAVIGNEQAFTPSVDVAADGTVAVTYYDFRNNTEAADLPTDYFVVHCHPGASVTECTSESDWVNEVKLTNTSFDMRQAPFAGGFFTGDYEGLASEGNDFGAFFGQTHGTDPGSIFFRRVGP
jgi:hypothetical protein